MILISAFSVILIQRLLLREVNKGYFGCWITTPMSRKVILNSKFLLLISSLFILIVSVFLTQLLLFTVIFADFNTVYALHLFAYFISLSFVTLLITTINWCLACYFINNSALALSLVSTIASIFVVFAIFAFAGEMAFASSLQKLIYFKYLTFWSFLKQITFSDSEIIITNPGVAFAPIKSLHGINFIWQIPTLLLLTTITYYFSHYFFIKKDLFL